VGEEEIRQAIVLMLEHTHNLPEGAGAAPLAAAIKLKRELAGKKVTLIQSGGNLSLARLKGILETYV
jgi:threonine dehydratase